MVAQGRASLATLARLNRSNGTAVAGGGCRKDGGVDQTPRGCVVDRNGHCCLTGADSSMGIDGWAVTGEALNKLHKDSGHAADGLGVPHTLSETGAICSGGGTACALVFGFRVILLNFWRCFNSPLGQRWQYVQAFPFRHPASFQIPTQG